MSQTITLAIDVEADAARTFEILSTTEGQRAFWTEDCDVSPDRARFGFQAAPVDLETDVTLEDGASAEYLSSLVLNPSALVGCRRTSRRCDLSRRARGDGSARGGRGSRR